MDWKTFITQFADQHPGMAAFILFAVTLIILAAIAGICSVANTYIESNSPYEEEEE